VRSYGGRLIAVGATAVLLVGACAGGDADDLEEVLRAQAPETEGPEPEPTAVEDELDDGEDAAGEVDLEAFAPPAEIDEAYVLSVLDAMHEGFLPALRDAVAAGEVTPELEAALADQYTEDQLDLMVEGWEIGIAAELDGQELIPMRQVPDAREHLEFHPRLVSDECIVGSVVVDTRPWYELDEPWPEELEMVLVQAEPAPPWNPTPWRIAYEGLGGPGAEACR
jgi:hypothetical protein